MSEEITATLHLLRQCLPDEANRVLIIYDLTTFDIVIYFEEALNKLGKLVKCEKIPVSNRHGEEPSYLIRDEMLNSDVTICLTKYSLAHTAARRDAEAVGKCFLSMPDFDSQILRNPAIFVDYRSKEMAVSDLAKKLTNGRTVCIRTKLGTNLKMNIDGRVGNSCPGFVNEKYLLGSPPDIEANIAPVEDKTEGVIVVDGSITDDSIGCVHDLVILEVKNGRVTSVSSVNNDYEVQVERLFARADQRYSRVIGEFGIGLNDKAELMGNMLIDEGTYGCIHFGIGSNWTIGGKNKVDFHLDFVMKEADVFIDSHPVIKNGDVL